MTSKQMRKDPLFMRNTFQSKGKWGFPFIKKQTIELSNIELISCAEMKTNECSENKKKGVHHFVDDYRFSGVYDHPGRSLKKYSQYAFVLSPDFSVYADMNPWRQIENVAKNRWVGAYWQNQGLIVIPTISWAGNDSYSFCFDSIEKGCIVSVGMIGCRRNYLSFMRGYYSMLEHICPSAIIVVGIPYPEMDGNIIPVKYDFFKKGGKKWAEEVHLQQEIMLITNTK